MAVLKEAEELLKKWNGGFGALKTPKPGPFYFYVFDLTFCQKTFIL